MVTDADYFDFIVEFNTSLGIWCSKEYKRLRSQFFEIIFRTKYYYMHDTHFNKLTLKKCLGTVFSGC